MDLELNQENFTGSIRLHSSHNIIIGHKPAKLGNQCLNDKLCNKPDTEIGKFGFWDASSPNYSTYYPDVTAEDLKPKEADFINPVFRMLSEVIVQKGYKPIDFTKNGVLKRSMHKLLGQTIYIDHETATGNAIGAIPDVFWQEAYTSKDGVKVPAGINAVMKIDGKSNPRIARGVLMDPPSIHSNSVTVAFKWEPSHSYDNIYDFWDAVGTYDSKGELVRLIVTEIIAYHETSLVGHGADPFAQKIQEDNEINNAKYADSQYSFTADKPISGEVIYNYKDIGNLDNSIPKINNNNKKETQMKKIIEELLSAIGLDSKDVTEENFQEVVTGHITELNTKLSEANKLADGLKEKLTAKETEVGDLTSKVASLEVDKAEFDKALKLNQDEAVRLYKLAKGDRADDVILNMIKTSDLKTVTSFVKQYRDEAEENFSATCNACGSTDISRASAQTSQDGLVTDTGKGEDGNKAEKPTSEVIRNMRNTKKTSRIFQE